MEHELRDLVSAAREWLLEECSDIRWLTTDRETCDFFRKLSRAAANSPSLQAPQAPKPPVAPPQQQLKAAKPVKPSKPRPIPRRPMPKKQPEAESNTAPAGGKPRSLPDFEKRPAPELNATDPIQAFLSKSCPQLQLVDRPLDDSRAREINSQWQRRKSVPAIVLLTDANDQREIALLHNLARALTLQHAAARLIHIRDLDQKQAWGRFLDNPDIQVVITLERLLKSHPELVKTYDEQKLAGRVHVFMIEEAGAYLAAPETKATLWQTLTQTLRVWL